jgi:hypothetical protein
MGISRFLDLAEKRALWTIDETRLVRDLNIAGKGYVKQCFPDVAPPLYPRYQWLLLSCLRSSHRSDEISEKRHIYMYYFPCADIRHVPLQAPSLLSGSHG